MTEFSYPYGSTKIATEDEFSRMMRWAAPDGVCGSWSGPELRPTANGSGTVTVPPGEAFVRGQKYLNDGDKQLTVPPNSTGATRLDYVVLRNSPAEDRITAEYKPGGTSLPPLVQSWNGVWEIPIGAGKVKPGAAGVQPEDMVDARLFTGWPVAPSLPASRPAPYRDRMICENGVILIGTGTDWRVHDPFADTGWVNLVPNGSNADAWSPSGVSRIRCRDRRAELRLSVRRWASSGLGTADDDGSCVFNLAPQYRPPVEVLGFGYAQVARQTVIAVNVESGGDVRLRALVADLPASRTVQAFLSWFIG
ncbi:hypothetical protein [Actinomadura litoris]|uniref:hypothetical protein n=1 Tax=Actinomadura litoris TaxID=2678616 RepID=UPI001FA72AC4|nr:hypothetical protein [Actinomadura litoris]